MSVALDHRDKPGDDDGVGGEDDCSFAGGGRRFRVLHKPSYGVIAGLVPAIELDRAWDWIPGKGPVMTNADGARTTVVVPEVGAFSILAQTV